MMGTALSHEGELTPINFNRDTFTFYPQRPSILKDESPMEKPEEVPNKPSPFTYSTPLISQENNEEEKPEYVTTPGAAGYSTRETDNAKLQNNKLFNPDDYLSLHGSNGKS